MLKKDLLELGLLHLISEEDQYGYELLRRLYTAFPNTQESTIYAVLRGLCREACTEAYPGKTSGGPVRKYYRLTERGRERYETLLESWRSLCAALAELGLT